MLRAAMGCANRLAASDEKIGFDYKLKRFLQGSLLSSEAAHVFWNGTFSEEEKRTLFRFADRENLHALRRFLQLIHVPVDIFRVRQMIRRTRDLSQHFLRSWHRSRSRQMIHQLRQEELFRRILQDFRRIPFIIRLSRNQNRRSRLFRFLSR